MFENPLNKNITHGEDKQKPILGTYESFAALITAHPTGNVEDRYTAGTDTYFWNTLTGAWDKERPFSDGTVIEAGQITPQNGVTTIRNMPIDIQIDGLTATDKEQLTMRFENDARHMYGFLTLKFGEAVAKNFKLILTTANVPAVLEEKSVTPTTADQVITPSSGKDGISKVTVSKVTSAIDTNIVAGNIKKDVVILGVTGTYTGA